MDKQKPSDGAIQLMEKLRLSPHVVVFDIEEVALIIDSGMDMAATYKAAKARYDWCKFEVSIPSVTRRWDGEVFTVYVKDEKSLDILNRIVAGFERNQWIRCSDRMPTEEDSDINKLVLVGYPNEFSETTYWGHVVKHPDLYPYWQPLPTPPEEL